MAGIRGFVGQLHSPVRACPPHFMSSTRCVLVDDYVFRIADCIPFFLGTRVLTTNAYFELLESCVYIGISSEYEDLLGLSGTEIGLSCFHPDYRRNGRW